ncbi:POK10 protein, partial [Zosterops hypoxanthus]|nr:POK10 protein [Zosterops hypoxanthus]
KVQRMPPWSFLGLEITSRTIRPQKLVIKEDPRTLADLQRLCGSLNWVRPWLGITTEDLVPLFNLLRGGEELNSPKVLTQEARLAIEKVQSAMSNRQAHRCLPDLPFKFIVLGRLTHIYGVIFQWDKDKGQRDPLLTTEWVFLSHLLSKSITKPQELVAQLIRKARGRLREMVGCDFSYIHLPLKLSSGKFTKEMLEQLLQENEALQFALDSYPGQISIHNKLSRKPLKALTVFTTMSGASHRSVVTWKDPQTQQWESDIEEVEGSPQIDELAVVVRAFEMFSEPFILIADSAYVAGVVSRAENLVLREISNPNLFNFLSKLIYLISHQEQPYYVMHVRSHTDLPGF